MARIYDVMVAGHLCLDITPRFGAGARRLENILRPGQLSKVGDAAISTGGVVSNSGIALKKLGSRVCFCARVGDDHFGQMTLALLRRYSSDAGIRVMPRTGSSYSIVVAPPGIDRIFLHNPATNDLFGPEDINPRLVAQCRHFHFGYPAIMRRMYADGGRELAQIFKMARAAGATTSCDLAFPDPDTAAGKAPWPEIFRRALPFIDIFLPSIEEVLVALDRPRFMRLRANRPGRSLLDLIQPEEYSRHAQRLLELGAKVVALKAGKRGVYLRTGDMGALRSMGAAKPGDAANWADRELWGPPYTCRKIISATGAGDCAIAGFLHAFLSGAPVEVALSAANCLGWQNIQVVDAVSGVRSWSATQRLLARGLPVDRIALGRGWRWNAQKKVWHGPNDGV